MVLMSSPTVHRLHGASFASYVAPSSGGAELCAWKVAVEPGVVGQAHRITKEEVFLVLGGNPVLTVDHEVHALEPGEVVFAPAGAEVRLDNQAPDPAELWVTTTVGLTARMADGSQIAPPWTM